MKESLEESLKVSLKGSLKESLKEKLNESIYPKISPRNPPDLDFKWLIWHQLHWWAEWKFKKLSDKSLHIITIRAPVGAKNMGREPD